MANEKTRKVQIVRSYGGSEFFEILTAAVAVIGMILAPDRWYIVLSISLFLLVPAVELRFRGGALEASEEAERRERERVEMHVVTAERLRTLEVVGAGADVVVALNPLLGREPMPAKALIAWLERELGPARAQETLDVVRRYTLTGTPGEPAKPRPPEEREAAGAAAFQPARSQTKTLRPR